MAYSKKKKLWCVKQMKLGITSTSDISKYRRIPRRTLYRWQELFKRYGEIGLENKIPGRKKQRINVTFQGLVLSTWSDLKCGAPKMHFLLTQKGFSVSQRQIQKIYVVNGLKMNKRSRPSQIKFVKYEWPKPNMLWHTDWTTCPFTKKQLIAFIDDHSRFIVHAEYFENATAENTILAFANAIARYGKPENVLTDNGTQFTPARGENGPFTKFCESHGIKHILGKVHHPQTNGKIERWFGTYKQEYDERFSNLNEFLYFYNERRIHQGINYSTPFQRYNCAINSV
jgi:putative transposase